MLGAHPKTTVIGVVLILGSLCYLGMRAWHNELTIDDLQALVATLAGAGLLGAADSK